MNCQLLVITPSWVSLWGTKLRNCDGPFLNCIALRNYNFWNSNRGGSRRLTCATLSVIKARILDDSQNRGPRHALRGYQVSYLSLDSIFSFLYQIPSSVGMSQLDGRDGTKAKWLYQYCSWHHTVTGNSSAVSSDLITRAIGVRGSLASSSGPGFVLCTVHGSPGRGMSGQGTAASRQAQPQNPGPRLSHAKRVACLVSDVILGSLSVTK